jgi:LysM repeat protein
VQPGETLSGIAARHGVALEALARRNGLRDPDRIEAGAVLAIPSANRGARRQARAAAVSRTPRDVAAGPPRAAPPTEPAAPGVAALVEAELVDAEASYWAADFARAREGADRVRERIDADDPSGSLRRVRARAALLAGMVAAAEGDDETAFARFQDALADDPALRPNEPLSPRVAPLWERASAQSAPPGDPEP